MTSEILDVSIDARVALIAKQLADYTTAAENMPNAALLVQLIASAHGTVTQELVRRVIALEIVLCQQLAAVATVLDAVVAVQENICSRLGAIEEILIDQQQEATDVTALPTIDFKKGLPS